MIPIRVTPGEGVASWVSTDIESVSMKISNIRSRLSTLGLALVVLATANLAFAQLGGADPGVAAYPSLLREPIQNRVYQRNAAGKADIAVSLGDDAKGLKITGVTVNGLTAIHYRDEVLSGVPTGGPYEAIISVEQDGRTGQFVAGPFFVGDLWVLAGQSNMEGVGDLTDVTPPNDFVMLLGMDGKWTKAEEPLHWLVDSPDPVHSGDPATREERSKNQHKNRTKGAGLGLPFASVMVNNTGVPIGLVACAHGGTSMEQWSPAKKDDGGNSLYGSMLRQVKLAGGKVKGVLWYQGESDANPTAVELFQQKFTEFIAAVRADFGRPELPFYYVQIGRFIMNAPPIHWNKIQDIQRTIPETVPNTAVISVLDLELDDLIHVGTQGLKRAGTRLAKVALRNQFGRVGAGTPTFDHVSKGLNNTIVVHFKDVNFTGENQNANLNATVQTPPMNDPSNDELGVFAAAQPAVGLKPVRHVAGFSIRKADGTPLQTIFDARVGTSKNTVVLKLTGKLPDEPISLWYGWGYDPICNLVDSADMAVPMFGPISLDGVK